LNGSELFAIEVGVMGSAVIVIGKWRVEEGIEGEERESSLFSLEVTSLF